ERAARVISDGGVVADAVAPTPPSPAARRRGSQDLRRGGNERGTPCPAGAAGGGGGERRANPLPPAGAGGGGGVGGGGGGVGGGWGGCWKGWSWRAGWCRRGRHRRRGSRASPSGGRHPEDPCAGCRCRW